MNYKDKYLKYKKKYLDLKKISGGSVKNSNEQLISLINSKSKNDLNDEISYNDFINYFLQFNKDPSIDDKLEKLKDKNFNLDDLNNSKLFTLKQLVDSNIFKAEDWINFSNLENVKNDVKDKINVQYFKEGNQSAYKIKEAGYNLKELKEAGFDLNSLYDAGFSLNILRQFFELKEFKIFDIKLLKDNNFKLIDLKKVGFTLKDLYEAESKPTEKLYTLKELKELSFTLDDFAKLKVDRNYLIPLEKLYNEKVSSDEYLFNFDESEIIKFEMNKFETNKVKSKSGPNISTSSIIPKANESIICKADQILSRNKKGCYYRN